VTSRPGAINYWNGLKDSPPQMQTCPATFANVLKPDDQAEPVNEKYAERRLGRGSTNTAQENSRPGAAAQSLGSAPYRPARPITA
jgi:hypothetical protein